VARSIVVTLMKYAWYNTILENENTNPYCLRNSIIFQQEKSGASDLDTVYRDGENQG
jgi:hypothetical protein